MSVIKYTEDGKEYWKVYVHLRSSNNRNNRIQKSAFKIDSEAKARKIEKRLLQQAAKAVQKIDGKGLTWDDVVHLWKVEIESGFLGDISDRSIEGYFSILQCWTKHWGDLIASEITKCDGRNIARNMTDQGRSKRYIKKVLNLINIVFEWGVQDGYIPGNPTAPCRGINLGKIESKVPDILSLEEIKKLLIAAQAINHNWYSVWGMALLTGMRSGELHALTWEQIDLEKNIIMVDRSYDSNTKTVGPTKGRYWRTIPISDNLKDLILDLKGIKKIEMRNFVLPRIKDWDNGDQAVTLKNFLKSIDVKPIKFHALRSCWATQLLANGVSAAVVMKIGGWKKMATMDIYLRLAGVDVKGATDCLNFVPSKIDYSDNVVNLYDFKQT